MKPWLANGKATAHRVSGCNGGSYTGLSLMRFWSRLFKLPLTITGDPEMKEFRTAKKRVEVSVGESVRILRELQELSQSQLAELTGIPQTTISAIENGRVNLGVERAKVLAKALKCHPAVLVFPGWEVPLESAA
jgi:DNA-binding XRE family transcriptional regulator